MTKGAISFLSPARSLGGVGISSLMAIALRACTMTLSFLPNWEASHRPQVVYRDPNLCVSSIQVFFPPSGTIMGLFSPPLTIDMLEYNLPEPQNVTECSSTYIVENILINPL